MARTAPRILVVDGLVDHRDLLSQVLLDLGYEVDTAGDGVEALEKLRQGPRPQLVLADYWMPGMDGCAFLLELRRAGDDLPVVIMSADPEGVERKMSDAPPDLLLEKPFGLKELRRAVLRFCGQGHAQDRPAHGPAQEPE